MKNEYIVRNPDEIERIQNEESKLIVREIIVSNSLLKIANSDSHLLILSTESNNKHDAEALDLVSSQLEKKYNLLILSKGSSEHFNKMLYPSINEFERKLRKVLYLAASINNEKEASETIKNLETFDFGKLFGLLFEDNEFKKNVKNTLKTDMNGLYTKSEVIKQISSFEENNIWNRILGDNKAPTFLKNLMVIKEYRNNVMHAHNINFVRYRKIRNIYKTINGELDDIIEELLEDNVILPTDANEIIRDNLTKLDPPYLPTELLDVLKGTYSSYDVIKNISVANMLFAEKLREAGLTEDKLNNLKLIQKRYIDALEESGVNRAFDSFSQQLLQSEWYQQLNQNSRAIESLRNFYLHGGNESESQEIVLNNDETKNE